MSDDEDPAKVVVDEAQYKTIQPVRTIPEIPVVFADGVANHVMGPGISKFHFYRTDAILGKLNVFEKVEALQLIMPANSFVDMVAFFEHRLKVMVKYGNVTQSVIDDRREFYSRQEV
jgi:hypothetical protein